MAWLCRAPHLEHYFKAGRIANARLRLLCQLSEDILKRNMKEIRCLKGCRES